MNNNNLSLNDINLYYDLLMCPESPDFDKLSIKYNLSVQNLQDILDLKLYSEKTEKFVSQLILVLFQVKNPQSLSAEDCLNYIKILNQLA